MSSRVHSARNGTRHLITKTLRALIVLLKTAVSAMRDPTEEMVEAGDGAKFDLSSIFVWQAMIDKLLDKDRG